MLVLLDKTPSLDAARRAIDVRVELLVVARKGVRPLTLLLLPHVGDAVFRAFMGGAAEDRLLPSSAVCDGEERVAEMLSVKAREV